MQGKDVTLPFCEINFPSILLTFRVGRGMNPLALLFVSCLWTSHPQIHLIPVEPENPQYPQLPVAAVSSSLLPMV